MKSGNVAINVLLKAISIIIMIALIILMVQGARKAYRFGYAIFMDESMTSEEDARDITINIAEGDSVLDIGEMLERRGLIEDAYVFVAQSYCYEAGRKLKAGSYDLTTNMNAKDIMKAIVSQSEEKASDGE